MKTVTVHASKTYDVTISRGLLAEAGARVKAVTAGSACALVTDDTVGPLWGGAVKRSLEDAGLSVCEFTVPHGEQSKNAKTYVGLLEFLAEHHLMRAELPVETEFGLDDLVGAMAADKKRAGDTITLVIPKKIGEVELRKLPLSDLRGYIAAGL